MDESLPTASLRQEVPSRPAGEQVSPPLGHYPRRRRRRASPWTLRHLYLVAFLALRDRLDRIHEATGNAGGHDVDQGEESRQFQAATL